MKDLNVKFKATKLEENVCNKLYENALSNIFLYVCPQAKATKEKINKWNHAKLKSFCTVREILTKPKDNLLNGRSYLTMRHEIRGCYPAFIYKPIQSTVQKSNPS